MRKTSIESLKYDIHTLFASCSLRRHASLPFLNPEIWSATLIVGGRFQVSPLTRLPPTVWNTNFRPAPLLPYRLSRYLHQMAYHTPQSHSLAASTSQQNQAQLWTTGNREGNMASWVLPRLIVFGFWPFLS